MRAFVGVMLSLWLLSPALAGDRPVRLAAQAGCIEPGDSDFYYPVGNIIKYCGKARPGEGGLCDEYLCTRCQANGNWSDDYVCSKPDRR
jgi:hypothetical protein